MVAALLHSNTLTDPIVYNDEVIGETGVGAVNLTRLVSPPTKPQPEREQGVGRSAVTAWEHQDHIIHDNPDWHLGQPQMFEPQSQGPSAGAVQTRIPQQILMELDYYQQHEAQSSPGMTGPTTVNPGIAIPQTQRAIL
jgi:hypothetical protein